MGAIEKALINKVEGLPDQTQEEKRVIDQRMAQMHQRRPQPGSKMDWKPPPIYQPPMCSMAALPPGVAVLHWKSPGTKKKKPHRKKNKGRK